MTILIVIATLVGTTFLIYQLHKYIKEKNEDAEQSITIENFANVYFDGFTVGKDAQANAHEYDEYKELFENEEETANRIYNEMFDDDFLLDFEDEIDSYSIKSDTKIT